MACFTLKVPAIKLPEIKTSMSKIKDFPLRRVTRSHAFNQCMAFCFTKDKLFFEDLFLSKHEKKGLNEVKPFFGNIKN